MRIDELTKEVNRIERKAAEVHKLDKDEIDALIIKCGILQKELEKRRLNRKLNPFYWITKGINYLFKTNL